MVFNEYEGTIRIAKALDHYQNENVQRRRRVPSMLRWYNLTVCLN
jgi:hypothetical protein